jgi:hypothetical protein
VIRRRKPSPQKPQKIHNNNEKSKKGKREDDQLSLRNGTVFF